MMGKKSPITSTDVEMIPPPGSAASKENAVREKAMSRGPIKNRSCTDIICLVLFVVFIAGYIVISIFAYTNGDPRLLLHPVDSNGNRCGMVSGNESFVDRPNLHFFDLSECFADRIKNPLKTITKITDFSCPTKQVCVKTCPNITNFYLAADPAQRLEWPCEYDVDDAVRNDRTKFENAVRGKRCAPYLVPSEPLFGRCFPGSGGSGNILKFVKEMIDNNLKDQSDAFSNDTDATTVEGALSRFWTDMMDLQGTVDKLMADFSNSWVFLLILMCIACVVCFLWIVLMRWIAAPMVWLSLIAFLAVFIFGTYYCADKYVNDSTLKDETLEFTLDINSIKQNRNTWLALAIICGVFLFIILVTLIFLRSRIRIAIELIKESSKAVGSIMSTLIFPIFPFLLQLALFAGWTATMLYLVTSSTQIFVVSNSTNATLERAVNLSRPATEVQNGLICNKLTFAAEYGDTGAKCIYSHDGPNPNDPLFSHISGAVDNLDWAKVYVIFALLWLTNFIHALGEMTLAGAFASWYWAFDKKKDVPSLPLLASFWRCIRYHIGTLAFGSLIIAIVQLIRLMLEYVDRKLKNNENEVTKFIMKCLKCFFWCLEKFLKFINRNAYIMCAVHGRHFCASAKRAFMLILENCVRAVVLDKVVDFLLFIGKITVIGGMGVLSFYYYSETFNHFLPQSFKVELNYFWVPVIIIIIATWFVSAGFFSVYAMAVDTLFLSFLEDLDQNDGSVEKPYFMSKNLMKILGKKNKSPDDEEKKGGCCGCC